VSGGAGTRRAAELLDPGSGFTTTKLVSAVGAAARFIATVKRVDETYVVGSAAPFIVTIAPATNPEPLMLRVDAPAARGQGSTEATVGMGLEIVTVAVSVKVPSATEVAVIVTTAGLGGKAGAL
jgi:hypothetical protein